LYDKGMEKLSLRAIATEAKVNVAAINYHFGSKDNLILEIFAKSIESFEQIRDQLFREKKRETGKDKLTVEDLVKGYYMPWVRAKNKHPYSLKHLFQFFSSRNNNTKSLYGKAIQDIAKNGYDQFSQSISRALPNIDIEVLKTRINLAVAVAATHVMNEWFIEKLDDISGSKLNHERLIDRLVGMIEHGSIDQS
jgi:AcrR family transcriptional regulator